SDKALTPRPLGYIRRRLAPEFASHQIVQELAPVDTRGIECIFYGLLGYAALTQLHANPRRSIQTLRAAVHIRFGKTHIALQPLVAQTGQLRRDMRGTTETPYQLVGQLLLAVFAARQQIHGRATDIGGAGIMRGGD